MRLLLTFLLLFLCIADAFAEECQSWEVSVATTPIPPQAAAPAEETNKLLKQAPKVADILFIGDSLFQGWPDEFLRADFNGYDIWKFGIRQDKTQNVLWRLQRPEVIQSRVKRVVLWIGTNNLTASQPACAIIEGQKAIIGQIRKNWPTARIYLLPIIPRGPEFYDFNEARMKINNNFGNGLSGDVTPIIFDEKALTCSQYGKPPSNTASLNLSCTPDLWRRCANYQKDQIHLTDTGYRIQDTGYRIQDTGI